jgi:endoglycosylceramidase
MPAVRRGGPGEVGARTRSPRLAVSVLLIGLTSAAALAVAAGSAHAAGSTHATGSAHATARAGAAGVAAGWARAGMVRAPGGPYLTDSLGRRLELHGVNLVAKCGGGAVPAPVPGTPCIGPAQGPGLAFVLSPTAVDPARRFTAADAATLAGLGFNTVRLGIIWEGLEPGPSDVGPNDPRYCAPHRRGTRFPSLGRADPYDPAVVRAYLASTDTIIRLLARAGLRVVIDMHSDVYGSAFSNAKGATPWNGDGAPLWATCTGGKRFVAAPGWGSGYDSRAVQVAIHHFFANNVRADLLGQYARVWQAVARHYRDDREVIGYEIYNEPDDFRSKHFGAELECDYGGRKHEPRSCAASQPQAPPDGLIGAIQQADPNHVVFFQPSGATDFGGAEELGISEPLRFDRLALAFHVYGSMTQQLHQTAIERRRTRTRQPGGPAWIMDEFGALHIGRPIAADVDSADALNLSWTYWSAMQLDDPTGADPVEGLLNQTTRRPYPAVAHALAVPYPWATAGVPGRQSFDRRTRAFRYSWVPQPRRIRGPTEISIPSYTYPRGYSVQVTGGDIVSSPRAAVLLVAADPHQKRVSVLVRPA